MAGFIVGVEVGGTFTDWVVAESGCVVRSGKVLSNPKDPGKAVLTALKQAVAKLSDIAVLTHGSTVATNVVVEKKGAIVALFTTKGFRDVLLIQRQSKNQLFDLFYRQPEPLVTRDRILEVIEKIAPSGESRNALQADGVMERLGRLIAEVGVESVAISFIHAYANNSHEQTVADLVKQTYPNIYVTRIYKQFGGTAPAGRF
jgi:N-methylhydantoinase A